jgi:hypothetical protein
MSDCKSCGVQALVEDDYCLSCRRFKDHQIAVKEKMNIRVCANEWPFLFDGRKCDGEMKFHDRYWRLGFDDDRCLIRNVWICEKCGDVKTLAIGQKTIDEYKQNQKSLKSKVSDE